MIGYLRSYIQITETWDRLVRFELTHVSIRIRDNTLIKIRLTSYILIDINYTIPWILTGDVNQTDGEQLNFAPSTIIFDQVMKSYLYI